MHGKIMNSCSGVSHAEFEYVRFFFRTEPGTVSVYVVSVSFSITFQFFHNHSQHIQQHIQQYYPHHIRMAGWKGGKGKGGKGGKGW